MKPNDTPSAIAFRSRLLPQDVQRRLAYYPRTLAAVQYVMENLSRPIRLDDVAARAGMTSCAFSRYFAEKTSITFSSLVKVLRIEYAVGELERSDYAISELAERSGYQTCCSFSKVFKEVVGQTPTEYRRNVVMR